MSAPPLAERADIHKGCRSLETLLNLLNDYCEAASAIVLLQKKLAKSLRETSALKTNTDIAANALAATATIFEALADIDSKYAKLADKEYDSISTEVKKWFKKLAKEEKTHDERMAAANAKLKQAGQAFEKKSKKNGRDATEEHARYINLINTLGPEVSQEKYNHQFSVTQRHTTTTYSVASCVARLADAEWVKSCEAVRRFSPTIGHLGECRALCEGNWTGQVPYALPDVPEDESYNGGVGNIIEEEPEPQPTPQSAPPQQAPPQQAVPQQHMPQPTLSQPGTINARTLPQPPPLQQQPKQQNDAPSPNTEAAPQPAPASSAEGESEPSTASNTPSIPAAQLPAQSAAQAVWANRRSQAASAAPPSSYGATERGIGQDADTTGSIRSLSAFPAPPTHYPIPSARQASGSHSSIPESHSNELPRTRLSESPLPTEDSEEDKSTSPMMPHRQLNDGHPPSPSVNGRVTMPTPYSRASHDSSAIDSTPSSPVKRDGVDYLGLRRESGEQSQSRPSLERSTSSTSHAAGGTSGGGSIVAAMRNRYSTGPPGSSPPPSSKDVANVRLPMSVTDLASRYQPDSQVSPPQTPSSPNLRYRNISPPSSQARERDQTPRASFSANPTQIAELNEMQQKEEQLRIRERQIEMRAKELELQRSEMEFARQQEEDRNLLASPRAGAGALRPRERHTSLQAYQQPRTRSSADLSSSSNLSPSRPQSHYGYSSSTSNLLAPTSSEDSSNDPEHAPSCGCDKCSIAKYQQSPHPTAHDLRPPGKPIALRPEKPKGWMRRLSMPVVAQFTNKDHDSSASRKGISNASLPPYGRTPGAGMLSLDARKNGSSTTLRTQLGGVMEDGRYPGSSPTSNYGGGRRSYDNASGVSNRSYTNLPGTGRRL